MMYKAFVRNKKTGKYVVIESEYDTKADFIKDLRGNGYVVNPKFVNRKEVC